MRLAREEQRIIAFDEPIALYPMRDLHAVEDGEWMGIYPARDERIPLGDVGVHGRGSDLAIVSYANGAYLSRQAQKQLAERGIDASVIDLRWLAPLPAEALLAATKDCKRVLVVDECRRTGGQSEALMAFFVEESRATVSRIAAADSFIATGPAYAATLPSVSDIVAAASEACRKAS